jgi:hypothetical protein
MAVVIHEFEAQVEAAPPPAAPAAQAPSATVEAGGDLAAALVLKAEREERLRDD